MKHTIGARWHRLTYKISHKIQQTRRLSRKTVALGFLLAGATLVAVVSLIFAHLADYALELNAQLVARHPWFAWVALPFGFMLIVWLTRRYAPYTVGSGIPQVLASLSLPYGPNKSRLINLPQTLLKIPLTFLGMLIGASIGREGPSVQVGAAVMSAWGKWCKKRDLAFRGLQENDLIAAGAAGGLAAAFNAPLAGWCLRLKNWAAASCCVGSGKFLSVFWLPVSCWWRWKATTRISAVLPACRCRT